jgi:predicted dehydrogenase
MIDASRKAGRKLMVAYRCRYEPYNQEAIRIVG